MIKIRRGKASLRVAIGGAGSRASMLILGGCTGGVDGSGAADVFRKSPGFSGTTMLGLNWCNRLANDSFLVGGVRGGSIGKNMKGTVW